MEKRKSIKISALAAGTILMGTISANAAQKLSFEELGTGAELRSELLSNLNPVQFFKNTEVELTCGEGKCGEKSKDAKKEATDKSAEKTEGKVEDKASEHKCGEGKCGEKSTEEKKEKKAEKGADDKAGEHKCGEGKCGN